VADVAQFVQNRCHTPIRFDLPQSQNIELAIYNLAAQRVATLMQGHREAGSYSVRWDGVTDAGLELASGVYSTLFMEGSTWFSDITIASKETRTTSGKSGGSYLSGI
jgi:flagellar hook assembly protein FlgD